MIEDKIEPQGEAKDAVARNASLKLFDNAGVDAPTIICTNNGKINVIIANSNSILLITTISVNNNHDPLILPNTSDSDTLENKDHTEDKENDKDNMSNND
jgi:hypothetical protein